MKFIKQLYTNLLFLTYFFIFAADVIALKFKSAGIYGASLWHVSYLLIVILSLHCLKELLVKLSKKKFLLTILTLATLIFMVFINISNTKNFSHESTQEVGCALEQYRSSKDGGFRQTCLFGYPSRQFFLPLWPSLLAGRSQYNLNLGMSFYFFLAVIIFTAGMIKHFKDDLKGDLITGIILSFIFHIYFFNHFMFLYEQSIFPFCFGLILCGLFLHYLNNKSNNNYLLLMGLTIYYLVFSYTPSLSLVILSLLVLSYLFFKPEHKGKQKLLILAIFIASVVSILISLNLRDDLHFVKGGTDYKKLGGDLMFAAKHIFFKATEDVAFISPTFQLVFVFLVISSLAFIFGLIPAAIAWWIIFTILISVISEGYSYYVVPMRLHRATVIFPVFFTLIIYLLKTHFNFFQSLVSGARQKLLVVIYLIFFLCGLLYSAGFLEAKENNRHLLLANWLSKNLALELPASKKEVYVDIKVGSLESALVSMGDIFIYLDPQTKSTYVNDYCGVLTDEDGSATRYLITSDVEPSDCVEDNLKSLELVDAIKIEDKKFSLYKISFK